jgi:DNA-binding NarL/FixJ family response regulator
MTTGAPEPQPTGDADVGSPPVRRRRRAAKPKRVAGDPASLVAFLKAPFASPGTEVTLALVGGQRLLRDATASLLASEGNLRVLGTFEDVDHLLSAAMDKPPEVLLLDCDETGPAGWRAAIARLSSSCAESRVVMLCGKIHEEVIRCAIEQRVSGVVLKNYSTSEIREAIVYIATGRTVMPAGWQRALAPHAVKPLGLSPRHRQILALIAQGHGNEEIAAALELSPNTVKFHIRVLYSRLGVRNRVEAANRHAQMTRGGD